MKDGTPQSHKGRTITAGRPFDVDLYLDLIACNPGVEVVFDHENFGMVVIR